MKILHVVGARPNFMKIAPVIAALERAAHERRITLEQILVHTGQHYDRAMSELFFEELGLPEPQINLGVHAASQGAQTGRIIEQFEQVLLEQRPDLVVVVGDVNSTVACTLDAKKLGIPVAHVEAGLRSGDMSMPEEINRRMTDAVADLLLTTEASASNNLLAEGVAPERIRFVGNVMIDTLQQHREQALRLNNLAELGLRENGTVHPYAVATLHRPSNVDNPEVLGGLGEALSWLGQRMPVLFPVHPRTRARIEQFGLQNHFALDEGVRLLEPQGYLEFLNLLAHARLVLTDSGGVQEETTILRVPCLTLRPNTERPVTVEQGSNRLVGTDVGDIKQAISEVLSAPARAGKAPELWDGHAAERIAEVILSTGGAGSAIQRDIR